MRIGDRDMSFATQVMMQKEYGEGGLSGREYCCLCSIRDVKWKKSAETDDFVLFAHVLVCLCS